MPILQLENSRTYTDIRDIAEQLAPLQIQIKRLPLGNKQYLPQLLRQDTLNRDEKEFILSAFDDYFAELKRNAGCKWRELTLLHPGSPYLYALITQFDRCHTHTDDEALYILSGECVFGFVLPNGRQMEIILHPEDYINIPAGIEHWLRPTASLHWKAVRYFMSVDGWIPQYTDTEIHFRPTVAKKYPSDCA